MHSSHSHLRIDLSYVVKTKRGTESGPPPVVRTCEQGYKGNRCRVMSGVQSFVKASISKVLVRRRTMFIVLAGINRASICGRDFGCWYH